MRNFEDFLVHDYTNFYSEIAKMRIIERKGKEEQKSAL